MNCREIKESPFGNTYGSLGLMQSEDGKQYLRMTDCFPAEWYGPLTGDQITAFYVLCGVAKIDQGQEFEE